MSTMSRTSLRLTCLLATSLLLWPTAHGAEGDARLPAWPQALQLECVADCGSTLTSTHEFTFVSRAPFPAGSALLTGEAKAELLRMLVELENHAIVSHLEIVGHADPSGPENYNVWLTGKRAERVAWFFRQSGVDPRMISVTGKGSAEPLPGAIDPSEHRRIEIRVTVRPFL